ncbi:MAG: acetyl-CoA carboxylase, biotin carboxyl carrier protein [Alphaproteobacteria bacterium]|nr:acetyl-CoA carboxylase, biotin carboxyl carrier protein [Alphaproteobacteria bacterium]MDA7988506.1 acetyl-CoA carboxylase, biotin carboxyl carrier protein [Alphaproteobacteria bacterium]MDA8009007.1 acetyl-CoA carboxylase, biotin carboxyl carrier protein [Alphaproteobacteria bacterium]
MSDDKGNKDGDGDNWLSGGRDAVLDELREFLRESGLTEVEIEENGRRVRLAAGTAATTAVAPPPSDFAYTTPPEGQSESLGRGDVAENAVVSPMVGTVYLSSEPGAEPFVRAGATVREGDTLLIIEAMKVMNPLVAPRGGVVGEVFVGDAQPVEYGQPLLTIT